MHNRNDNSKKGGTFTEDDHCKHPTAAKAKSSPRPPSKVLFGLPSPRKMPMEIIDPPNGIAAASSKTSILAHSSSTSVTDRSCGSASGGSNTMAIPKIVPNLRKSQSSPSIAQSKKPLLNLKKSVNKTTSQRTSSVVSAPSAPDEMPIGTNKGSEPSNWRPFSRIDHKNEPQGPLPKARHVLFSRLNRTRSKSVGDHNNHVPPPMKKAFQSRPNQSLLSNNSSRDEDGNHCVSDSDIMRKETLANNGTRPLGIGTLKERAAGSSRIVLNTANVAYINGNRDNRDSNIHESDHNNHINFINNNDNSTENSSGNNQGSFIFIDESIDNSTNDEDEHSHNTHIVDDEGQKKIIAKSKRPSFSERYCVKIRNPSFITVDTPVVPDNHDDIYANISQDAGTHIATPRQDLSTVALPPRDTVNFSSNVTISSDPPADFDTIDDVPVQVPMRFPSRIPQDNPWSKDPAATVTKGKLQNDINGDREPAMLPTTASSSSPGMRRNTIEVASSSLTIASSSSTITSSSSTITSSSSTITSSSSTIASSSFQNSSPKIHHQGQRVMDGGNDDNYIKIKANPILGDEEQVNYYYNDADAANLNGLLMNNGHVNELTKKKQPQNIYYQKENPYFNDVELKASNSGTDGEESIPISRSLRSVGSIRDDSESLVYEDFYGITAGNDDQGVNGNENENENGEVDDLHNSHPDKENYDDTCIYDTTSIDDEGIQQLHQQQSEQQQQQHPQDDSLFSNLILSGEEDDFSEIFKGLDGSFSSAKGFKDLVSRNSIDSLDTSIENLLDAELGSSSTAGPSELLATSLTSTHSQKHRNREKIYAMFQKTKTAPSSASSSSS
eukprot:Awhi_evm1s13356